MTRHHHGQNRVEDRVVRALDRARSYGEPLPRDVETLRDWAYRRFGVVLIRLSEVTDPALRRAVQAYEIQRQQEGR